MSKKIWRGYSEGRVSKVATQHPPYDAWRNCTVIDDSACFPVKEARALCKDVSRADDLEREDKWGEAHCIRIASLQKYIRAVERMKKKAKKGAKP